jgi:release factor glutamine methyltransferase
VSVAAPRSEAGTTVAQAIDRSAARLASVGCDSPRLDAELLLAHVLETTRAGVYAESRRLLSSEEEAGLESLLARRERREPLAYVLGVWGFRRLSLRVDPRVLVPRPETEIVVERALARIAGSQAPRVLDVGTGSGAIALAIAGEHPGSVVTGIDFSVAALEVAWANAAAAGLDVQLERGDLFAGLPAGPWDLVVSNPPYVRAEELDRLAPEVRDWEPRAALVATGATEAIAASGADVLREGGALVLEVAADDAPRVRSLLLDVGYEDVCVTRDLAGHERVVECTRP